MRTRTAGAAFAALAGAVLLLPGARAARTRTVTGSRGGVTRC